MKMNRLAETAALLLLCFVAMSCATSNGDLIDTAKAGNVAADAEDTTAAKSLISAFEAGDASTDDLNKALIDAAREGDTATVKALLGAGVNVNVQDEDGGTALMSAAREGQTDTVKALLSAGANANIQDTNSWTALIHAVVDEGHKDTARLLINVDANDSDAALVAAAADGNTARVRELIEGDASAGARAAAFLPLCAHGFLGIRILLCCS